tara:strand:+ start:895 stop:1539 length:645 start_codon:yes stop_codon:yes gene_type:complete
MYSEFSKIETIVKNSILKIALICLISTLISFFYISSKPTIETYNAKILFELGSLNRTQIDGLDALNAIALSLDKNNILVKQPFNHSHYLMISSDADNFEDAKNDLDNFINLILKRHDLMITKRSSEIYKSIKLLNKELNINTAETNASLVLKLIDHEDLVNSFTKSKILKDYGVEKTINVPNKSLAISTGLSIGLLVSLFLVLIQYIFYSNRKI